MSSALDEARKIREQISEVEAAHRPLTELENQLLDLMCVAIGKRTTYGPRECAAYVIEEMAPVVIRHRPDVVWEDYADRG